MPMRIVLIGAVVFLAAWFTVLKPKPSVDVPPIPTPQTTSGPQTSLGKDVEKAKAAAGQATATATATPATGAKTTTAAPAASATPVPAVDAPADALAKLPADVAAAFKAHKIVVLGVFSDDAKAWRPMADDDRYVRNALKKTNRYKGDVFVKRVGISKLSAYGALVNDLGVDQS